MKNYCTKPFTSLTLKPSVYRVCCQSYHSYALGTTDKDPMDAWLGTKAERLRRTILNGSYRLCQGCKQYIAKRDNGKWFDKTTCDIDYKKGPATIVLGDDRSCSLSCPSCRPEPICMSQSEYDEAKPRLYRFLDAFLPNAKEMRVSAVGDPFASRLYTEMLSGLDPEVYPNLRIELHTNGQLIKQRWNRIGHAADMVNAIHVSVDAGTKETYEANRRGGKWERLLENLAFIGTLPLKRFKIIYVVQENNWRELPLLVEIAKRVNATEINLRRLDNNRKANQQDYSERAVCMESHRSHKEMTRLIKQLVQKSSVKIKASHLQRMTRPDRNRNR